MNEKIINVAKELGRHVHEENGEYVDFAQFSPAGEDFGFTVSANDVVKEVRKYADGFDADEHAELWLDSRGKRIAVFYSFGEFYKDKGNDEITFCKIKKSQTYNLTQKVTFAL